MKSLLILLTIFKVAFVGDPQVDNATELGYARKSIYKELRERKDLDLVIVLGDIVNDDTSLLPATKQSLDSLSCPWLAVPGNHDRNLYREEKGRPRDLHCWEDTIGYVDTAFVAGDGSADAALAASIFHYGTLPIKKLKNGLKEKCISVR